MNSRSRNLLDYVDSDFDGINSIAYNSTSFIPDSIKTRVCQDKIVYEFRKRLIELCIANDIIIVNGGSESDT